MLAVRMAEVLVSAFCDAAQCEACGVEANAVFDDDNRLVELRIPVRLVEPVVEQCAWCGCATIFGVYVRTARAELAYPPSYQEDG